MHEGSPESGEARPERDDSSQAALLIDFDNVTMGIRSNLGQELRNLLNSDAISGNIAVQRAYADWRRYPQYIVPLSEASIDLIFAPAYGSSKKNATDIRLAIDALELIFIRPEIKTFILMSGDSDFSSLVLKLKEYGKYVIGVGIQESSSDLLVQNCDEYYSYSALAGLKKAGEEPLERHDPWVLVEKSIKKMVERRDTMRSDRLKQVMMEIDPTFNEKENGFNKFNRFVVEAASRGLLSIQKMDNGQYAVAPGAKVGPEADKAGAAGPGAKKKETKPEAKSQRRSASRRGGGRKPAGERESEQTKGGGEAARQTRRARPKLTLESAFGLLNKALDGLLEGPADSVRDSDVKRKILQLDKDFDEGELGFSKFSKFLLEAQESGAIELTRGPNGNFVVARTSRAAKRKRPSKSKSSEAAAAPKPGSPSEEQRESRSQSTMKKLARFFFGAAETDTDKGTESALARPDAEAVREPKRPAERRDESAKRRGGERPVQSRSKRPSPAKTANRADRSERERTGKTSGPSDRRTGRTGERQKREPAAERRQGRRPSAGKAETKAADAPSVAPRVESAAQPAPESQPVPPETTIAETSKRATTVAESGQPAPTSTESGKRTTTSPESGKPASAAAPVPGAPRGTIRGRWGQRGRYRPAEARPPLLEGQTGSRPSGTPKTAAVRESADSSGDSGVSASADPQAGSAAEIVSRLKKRYAGVGEKTAETLVDAFGSDVYRVLDEEPERVREVLPENRANRIIEARRQELKADGE